MVRRQRIHGFSHSRVRSTKIPKQQGKRLPNKQTDSKTVRKETNFSSNRINLQKKFRGKNKQLHSRKYSAYEGTNFPPRRAHLQKKSPTSLLTALPTVWDIYAVFAMTSRSSTELLGDFSSECLTQFPGCLLVLLVLFFGWALVFGCVVWVLFWETPGFLMTV